MAFQPIDPSLATILANNRAVDQQSGTLAQLALQGFQQGQQIRQQGQNKRRDFLKTTLDLVGQGVNPMQAQTIARQTTGFQDSLGLGDISGELEEISGFKRRDRDLQRQKDLLGLEKTKAETEKLRTDPFGLRELKLKEGIKTDINFESQKKLLDLKKEQQKPKIQIQLKKRAQDTQRVSNLIDQAINEVDIFSSGPIGAVGQFVGGTDARDLKATIDTIRANIGFDTLQAMRDASPTGGALGQVSEREINFLQSVLGNLELSQSPSQLRENLARAKQEIMSSLNRVREAFVQDFGGQQLQEGTSLEGKSSGGAVEGATATNPATGQRIIFRGGQWQSLG